MKNIVKLLLVFVFGKVHNVKQIYGKIVTKIFLGYDVTKQ